MHRALTIAVMAVASSTALAGTIRGTITDTGGKPVAASMVSVVRADWLYSETAYSRPDGQFELKTSIAGDVKLRVRSPGFRNATHPLRITASGGAQRSVQLAALSAPAEISASLTASSHFPRLAMLGDERSQKLFRNDCTGCHQIGNEFTRRPRTPEGWQAILELMLSNWEVEAAYKKQLAGEYARMLNTSFNGESGSRSLSPIRSGVSIPRARR